jgi:phosphatidylserine/phosphatidylglycerophosphate/cardiolipin synthase-like enzyme
MKTVTAMLIAVVLLAAIAAPTQGAERKHEVYFSPHGGCTEAVERELGKARSNVLVQAYSFTSARIAKALVDAHKRGVKVTVILDKRQRAEKYSSATFLKNAGVPTLIDDNNCPQQGDGYR